MSAAIVESDTYTVTINTPLNGETDYPTTITAALTGLANRANFWNKRFTLVGATDTRVAADDTDEFSSITIPDDALIGGTNVFKELATKLGNRTKYLAERIAGASSALTLSWPAAALAAFSLQGNWELDANGVYRYEGIATSGHKLEIYLPALPTFGKLSSVRALVKCGGGSSTPTTLPTTKPTLKIWKTVFDPAGSGFVVKTQVGATITDTSADLTAYKTPHYITVPFASETLATQVCYSIELASSNGDAGDNSEDFSLLTVEAALTV